MFWESKGRKEYTCDICKVKIPKGVPHINQGTKCLAYVMINAVYCLYCFPLIAWEKEEQEQEETLDWEWFLEEG